LVIDPVDTADSQGWHIPNPGEESMQICLVEGGDTWMTPYKHYLADRILPLEPTESRKIKKNYAKYTLIDGELFRYGFTHPILVCVSGDQCVRIIGELHERICGSHIDGQSLASKAIRAGYYWPTVREDYMRYTQQCKQCQQQGAARGAQVDLQPLPFPYMGNQYPEALAFGNKAYEVPRGRHRVLHEVDRR